MKIVTSLSDLAMQGPSVVSIGNFDGVHLGHQAILGRVRERARALGACPIAITFLPHPIRFLAPDRAPRLILSLDQKIQQIAEAGMEVLFLAAFDRAFSELRPEEFIQRYLLAGLQARAVCVGSNFNFGHRQSGTLETLRLWSHRMQIVEVPPVVIRGTTVSSSRIRQLIAAGQVSRACRLLGRWLEIEAEIVPDKGREKSKTVSVLNLKTESELLPAFGVYVTQVALNGGPLLPSMTNVGAGSIETHIFDGPIPYDPRSARLQFVRRLRGEMQFETAPDIERARRFFRGLQFKNAEVLLCASSQTP